MNSVSVLYEHADVCARRHVDVPVWIDQSITLGQIAGVYEGGCASGSYMPAVTYHQALDTMNEHGHEVLDFLESHYGEEWTEIFDPGDSWAGMACKIVSAAVETWVGWEIDEIADLITEEEHND